MSTTISTRLAKLFTALALLGVAGTTATLATAELPVLGGVAHAGTNDDSI